MKLQDLRAALVGRTLCFDDDGIPATFRVADVLYVALDGYTLVAAADREAAAPTGSTLTLPAAATLALIADGHCKAGGVLYTLDPATPPRGMAHDTVSAALRDAIIGRVVTFRGASGITLRFTVDGVREDELKTLDGEVNGSDYTLYSDSPRRYIALPLVGNMLQALAIEGRYADSDGEYTLEPAAPQHPRAMKKWILSYNTLRKWAERLAEEDADIADLLEKDREP